MKRVRVSTLIVVAMAAVAYAVPAAAHADDYWYVGGKKVGGAGAKISHVSQGMGTYKVAGGFTVGPCEYLSKNKLWNGATMGEGERTIWGLELPCITNVPGCNVQEANPKGLPWPITLKANGRTQITVTIDFTFQNNAACKGVGLGGVTKTIKGTVGGDFNDLTSCIDYEEEPGLSVELFSILYSDEDCFEVEEGEEGEGEPLTAEE